MRLLELVPKQTVILEGIDHPEDSIFTGGSSASRRAVTDIISLERGNTPLSIKWDGFPALVFGRDSSGKLVVVDKHQYDKVTKGKVKFSTIQQYDTERGANRSNLWAQEKVLRSTLEKVVPKVSNTFWMGDLLWTGKPTTRENLYVFKPNTVEYQVPRNSELGKKISKSNCGIAVHTYIPGLGKSDEPLSGLQGLDPDAGAVLLTGEMANKPKVTIDNLAAKQALSVIEQYGSAADQFISDVTKLKAKMVLTAASPFITDMLREGDITNNIVPRFLEFLKNNLTSAAAEKLLGKNREGWLYTSGLAGLRAIWTIWATVSDLKLQVKRQIDMQVQNSEVRAFTNGEESHEGFVAGGGADKIKLIDRLGFTAANFARHRVPQEEMQRKSQMPLAAFCFGRMNPPTLGHKLVMSTTVKTGGTNSFIFLSGSHNTETDPLDFNTKAAFIKKIYPEYGKHVVMDSVTTPIEAANWLYDKGFRNMTFIAGSDRLGRVAGSLEKLLNSWNSGPIRSTDYARGPEGREFVVLNFVSSGERDSDTTSVSGISGTLARKAAAENNAAKFKAATGVDDKIKVNGRSLFQAVQQAMGIKSNEAKKNLS